MFYFTAEYYCIIFINSYEKKTASQKCSSLKFQSNFTFCSLFLPRRYNETISFKEFYIKTF
jgi:hypothetical protein